MRGREVGLDMLRVPGVWTETSDADCGQVDEGGGWGSAGGWSVL